ncbi:TagK domain-containing protein [Burkholderia ubonensis]|nr:TagK domain-containing protein [Burkholderia ubonensis]
MRSKPGAIQVADSSVRDASVMRDRAADPITELSKSELDEDLRGSNAVLGLIGEPANIDCGVARDVFGETNAASNDLIATLHDQYCRALDNPWASLASADWVPQATSAIESGAGPADVSSGPPASTGGLAAMEPWFFGDGRLEQAFGPLVESEVMKLHEPEPVPEILRLFAPPGYEAAASRRLAALPPELARREHHAWSIDSPLPMRFPVAPRADTGVSGDITIRALPGEGAVNGAG